MKKISYIFLLSFILIIFVLPIFTGAADDNNHTYTLLQPLPSEDGELKEDVSLEDYMAWMYKFALALAGFLAVMQITIGGVTWIASGASEKLKGEAREKITNALWGLVLAFGAYLILYTINPDLVTFKNNKILNLNKNNATTENTENTEDNPYINEGASATEIEQSDNSNNNNDTDNSGINDKFENPQGTTKNSQFEGIMKSTE